MEVKNASRIWIATGGTGGHIFPALSVAAELVKRGKRVIISSDARGMSMVRANRPARAGIAFVWASGVGGRGKLRAAIALMKIGFSAIALTLRFMLFRPDRLVAFGGYASVPAILAAHIWRVPTFLHEQNAAIGRANLFAMCWVRTLMTSFPKVSGIDSHRRVIYTGLPVRSNFVPTEFVINPARFNLLVTGGSLGAQILDDIVPGAIVAMKNKNIFVTHQTRPENVAALQKFYAANKIHANVLSFINDMAAAVRDANLVIGRSGASTVVEIQTVGRPAIFVPLNINPDQAANAEAFAATGGGFAVNQSQFTQKWLTNTLSELVKNPARLSKMAEKSRVPNNAVQTIANTVTAS